MTLETTDIIIGTRTCVAQLNTTFDLQAIFLNLKISKSIKGLKYNNKTRGNVKTTGSFFNQLTVVLFLEKLHKETNVKVFSNGKFQISGIQKIEQAIESIRIILAEIVDIRGLQLIDVIVENGIIFNKHDYINLTKFDRFNYIKMYKKCENSDYYTFLGERKAKDKYILYNEDEKKYTQFNEEEGCFMDIAHKNFEKAVYDTNGKKFGYYKYNMSYKKKNLILHGCTYKYIDENKEEIYNKYKTLIGERIFVSNNVQPYFNDEKENIIVIHSAIEDETIRQCILSHKIDELVNEQTIEITNINSNFSLILNENKLNRIAIHNILSTKYGLLSYYKPESKYQAINVKLYFDKDYKLIKVTKNYAHKFTTTIFQNGKMMISGCRNEEHVKIVYNKLVEIFRDNYSDFITKPVSDSQTHAQKQESSNELSIWDLM